MPIVLEHRFQLACSLIQNKSQSVQLSSRCKCLIAIYLLIYSNFLIELVKMDQVH